MINEWLFECSTLLLSFTLFLLFDKKAIFVLTAKSINTRRSVETSLQRTSIDIVIQTIEFSSIRWVSKTTRRCLKFYWKIKKKILKNREIDVKRDLQNCMYEIRIDFDKKKHRTKINRKFQKLIVNYNNALFFCSEIVNVNFKHSDWVTFRVMRDVQYTLDSIITNEENRSKFCQIYQIDQSQETLDRRMKNDVDDNVLNRQILCQL